MITREKQLLRQFKESNNHQPTLLYGPNEGLSREISIKIKKEIYDNKVEEISFTGKSINEHPEIFIEEIQTISMFNDRKIIYVEQPIDKNISLFETAFALLPDQLLILLIADNLAKSSKIRKFFESSDTYLSCASYGDDIKTNSHQIYELEKKINKVFDKDIKHYLNKSLSSDRMISKNEIEKLILLYSKNNENPSLEKIRSIFNDNSDLGLNKIPQIVFSGNTEQISMFLQRVFSEGVSPIAIIRSMLNYVQRIEFVQIAQKKTKSFDDAIKMLKPPVFWKDKDTFQLHCKKWPIQETIDNFNILVNAELRCKADYALTNILCERALLKIAYKGKIYFQ